MDAARRLSRAVDGRVLFGVCGGLGRYFGIDPVIVRVGFVLFTLAGGAGVLLYLILLVVMPLDSTGSIGPAGVATATAFAGFMVLAGVVVAFALAVSLIVLIMKVLWGTTIAVGALFAWSIPPIVVALAVVGVMSLLRGRR